MEMKGQKSVIDKYFGDSGKFSNFLLKATLVIGIGQQIYFPQKLKYFHLAILFTYMIFLEFFRDDQRAFHEEYALIALVLGCSAVSIAEHLLAKSFSIVYLSVLLFGISLTGLLIFRVYKIVKSKKLSAFTKQNQKMLKKGTVFIKVLTLCLMTILVFSSLYVVYEIIKLF